MPSHDYLFEDPAESSTSSSRPHRAPKLKMKLKETDNERTERAWRKEQKRLRKETKKVYRANGVSPLAGLATTPPRDADRDQNITPPRKRRRSSEDAGDESDRRHAYGYDPDTNVNLGEWDEHVWQPQPTGFEKLKTAATAGAEEEAWRQKMFDLMEDEEGPNPFVSGRYYSPPPPRPPSPSLAESPQQRIPGRFKPPDGDVPPNFSMMDEEEYAEAIRYGMWRRQNKDEVERLERLKKLEEEEERKKARGKEAQEREEKKRIEVLKREKGVQETKRIQRELAEYKDKWEALRSSVMVDVGEPDGGTTLRMVDLPWPIFHGSSFHVFAPSLLSAEKIRAFYTAMIPSSSDTATATPAASSIDEDRAALKKILREAILAYHPDRFVGRYLGKVDEAEREMVKEAVIRTSQVINEIAADNQ